MSKARTINTTFRVTDEEQRVLLGIARDLGCTAATGAHADEPSISALLRAIAAGEVYVRRHKRARPRGPTKTTQIRTLLAEHPELSDADADVAALVGCSQSLVSMVRGGKR